MQITTESKAKPESVKVSDTESIVDELLQKTIKRLML